MVNNHTVPIVAKWEVCTK